MSARAACQDDLKVTRAAHCMGRRGNVSREALGRLAGVTQGGSWDPQQQHQPLHLGAAEVVWHHLDMRYDRPLWTALHHSKSVNHVANWRIQAELPTFLPCRQPADSLHTAVQQPALLWPRPAPRCTCLSSLRSARCTRSIPRGK